MWMASWAKKIFNVKLKANFCGCGVCRCDTARLVGPYSGCSFGYVTQQRVKKKSVGIVQYNRKGKN